MARMTQAAQRLEHTSGEGDEMVLGQDGWTEAHEKELKFQANKRMLRGIDAMGEGIMQPQDIAAEFGSEERGTILREEFKKAEIKREAAYTQRQAQQSKALAVPTLPTFHDRRLFIDCRINITDELKTARLRHFHMRITNERCDADVFLVPDVTNPGQRNMWHAMLSGCTLISRSVFLKGTGPSVTFMASMRKTRTIFVSDGFMIAHPTLVNILIARMRHAVSKWK